MMMMTNRIFALPGSLWERLEHALDRKSERIAAARYFAATGYDLPAHERALWLRMAARGAPATKHRASHPAR